jgi:hypothetical protein
MEVFNGALRGEWGAFKRRPHRGPRFKACNNTSRARNSLMTLRGRCTLHLHLSRMRTLSRRQTNKTCGIHNQTRTSRTKWVPHRRERLDLKPSIMMSKTVMECFTTIRGKVRSITAKRMKQIMSMRQSTPMATHQIMIQAVGRIATQTRRQWGLYLENIPICHPR